MLYTRLFLVVLFSSSLAFAGLEGKLLKAILAGDHSEVKTLLEKGADANHTVPGRESLLMCAAERGDVEIVKTLLEHGADQHHVSKNGETALTKACSFGRLQIAEHLLDKPWEWHGKSTSDASPLHLAVERRDYAMLRLLLEKGAPVDQTNSKGQSPLHLAAEFSNPAYAELLLLHQAFVNIQDLKGDTPLCYAARTDRHEVASRLLQYGANPFIVNRAGATALDQVPDWNIPLRQMLENANDPSAGPLQARPKLDLETLKTYVQQGLGPNQTDASGSTPLFGAVEAGELESVEYLLSLGADPNHVNHEGITPLMLASLHGRNLIAERLLSKGADPNYLTPKGFGALYLAGLRGDEALSVLLMEKGAYRVAKLFEDFIEVPKDKESYRRLHQQIRWLPNLTQASYQLAQYVPDLRMPDPDVAKPTDPGVTAPVFTQKVRPEYPRWALKIGAGGYVIIQATLGKDGVVRDPVVLRALEHGRFGFEIAAIEALQKWKFKPGTKDGEPVDVRMNLKMDFVAR